jgi:hypothetical protein
MGHHSSIHYGRWSNMMQRCYNPNSPIYEYYGGRGIRVDEEWHDPRVFIKWCESQKFKPGLQLDRIDNNSGYGPDNCRFVTRSINQQNKRLTEKAVKGLKRVKVLQIKAAKCKAINILKAGKMRCSICKKVKVLKMFGPNKVTYLGYERRCRACNCERVKARRKKIISEN